MRFSLAETVRRTSNPRRRQIVLRSIEPPKALAADLAVIYLQVVKAWETAAPRIVAEYERSLTPLHTDSADDLRSLFENLGREIDRLVLTLTPRLRGWALRTERWHRGKWRGVVLSATGIALDTILIATGVPVAVEETLAWNVQLIRDVDAQAEQRISNAVFSGLQQRKPAVDVAAEIREAMAMSRRRSIGIASDQLSKLTSALDTERMAQAGIEKFRYRHSGKAHPREWHKKRDGHLFELATGKSMDGEGDIAPDDMPGVPPFCACRKQAVVEFG